MRLGILKRVDAAARATASDPEAAAAVATLARVFGLAPGELADAPTWAAQLLDVAEGREPSSLHRVDWRLCGCAPCESVRRLVGFAPGACPTCGLSTHPVGSRPHGPQKWGIHEVV